LALLRNIKQKKLNLNEATLEITNEGVIILPRQEAIQAHVFRYLEILKINKTN